jgi:hypothetical protein
MTLRPFKKSSQPSPPELLCPLMTAQVSLLNVCLLCAGGTASSSNAQHLNLEQAFAVVSTSVHFSSRSVILFGLLSCTFERISCKQPEDCAHEVLKRDAIILLSTLPTLVYTAIFRSSDRYDVTRKATVHKRLSLEALAA